MTDTNPRHTWTANTGLRAIANRIAAQPPAAPHLIHQISGPPCAGKSTWIQQHTNPGDRVLDDNQLANHHGGRNRIPHHAWANWQYQRARLIHTWTGPGRLWYTLGNPTPHSPGITVTLLDPGPDECHNRAHRDHRPPITHQWIDTWYARHGSTR